MDKPERTRTTKVTTNRAPERRQRSTKRTKVRKTALPKGFETFTEAKDRRYNLIRALRAKSPPAKREPGHAGYERLAKKWDRCKKGRRCGSAACPVCLRLHRKRLLRDVMAIFEKVKDPLRFLTIIPEDGAFEPGSLHKVDLKMLKERWSKRIRRTSGIKLAFLGIDISYNCNQDKGPYWQLHLHGLVVGKPMMVQKGLRSRFKNLGQADVPVRADRLDDLGDRPKLLTYSLKNKFVRRTEYEKSNGDRGIRDQDLKSPQLRELAVFLDRHSVRDRILMRGVTTSGMGYRAL